MIEKTKYSISNISINNNQQPNKQTNFIEMLPNIMTKFTTSEKKLEHASTSICFKIQSTTVSQALLNVLTRFLVSLFDSMLVLESGHDYSDYYFIVYRLVYVCKWPTCGSTWYNFRKELKFRRTSKVQNVKMAFVVAKMIVKGGQHLTTMQTDGLWVKF